MLVAVGEDKRALLQEALGADADAVAFADMLRAGPQSRLHHPGLA